MSNLSRRRTIQSMSDAELTIERKKAAMTAGRPSMKRHLAILDEQIRREKAAQ